MFITLWVLLLFLLNVCQAAVLKLARDIEHHLFGGERT